MITLANRVPGIMIAVLVAAICSVTLSTVGRAEAAESEVARLMDTAGARRIEIIDTTELYFSSTVLAQIDSLSVTEQVVGVGITYDALNPALGGGSPRVPATDISYGFGTVARVTFGRNPLPGEGLITSSAMQKMGLGAPFGSIVAANGTTVGIVGMYEPREPYDHMNGILINSPGGTRTLDVVLYDAALAPATQVAIVGIIAPRSLEDLEIRSPATLAQVRGQVVGELAAFGRSLMLLIMGVGGLLVGAVVLADTVVRRSDLGRRRAIGASRSTIVLIVGLRTFYPAIAGSLIAIPAGMLVLRAGGAVIAPSFGIAVGLLAIEAAVLASLLPAAIASFQDPVRVLRKP